MLERYLCEPDTRPIPSTYQRYFVSLDGTIKTETGEVVEQTKDQTGNLVVWLEIWGKLTFYKSAVLAAHAFKPHHVPFELWPQMDVLFADGDSVNIHVSNLIWRFPAGGMRHPDHPSHSIVPGYTRYAITRDGEMIRLDTGESLNAHTASGYRNFSVVPDIGKRTIIGRHRAICLSWKEYPANVDKLDVNHKDGIPGNDTFDNLEWATRRANMLHAVQSGLHTDNTKILVRDCDSGRVTEYFSIAEAGRQLGIDSETVRLRLKEPGQRVYPGLLQFKESRDPTPWRVPVDPIEELNRSGVSRPVLARHVLTNEISEFESIGRCAKALKLNATSVSFKLRDGKRNVPYQLFCFKYKDDLTPWPEFSAEQLLTFQLYPKDPPKPMVVFDTHTKETLQLTGIHEAMERFQVTRTTVYAAIRSKAFIGRDKRYRIAWLNES